MARLKLPPAKITLTKEMSVASLGYGCRAIVLAGRNGDANFD